MCHTVNDPSQSTRENLALEIRRGAIVLAVLGRLSDEAYGYGLRKDLAERGLEIEEGTLYPLLRRLEEQGLLVSRWRTENGRRRRYYRISPRGEEVRAALREEWESLAHVMERLLR